jgi:cation diffusion facilitator family transporter
MSGKPLDQKARVMRAAGLIALFGNTALCGLKVALGIQSGSMAVLGDGIDSSIDVLIAIASLVVARVIARPADDTHPWGHGRAETVATAVLAFLLFFAGGQLILDSGMSLIRREVKAAPGALALAAAGVSIAGKSLLALSQYLLGKKAGSGMLAANAKNMLSDVGLSAGVLLGVGASRFFALGFIDRIAALLVGLWVLKSSISIFSEVNLELMDGAAGKAHYQALFEAVHSVPGASRPHRVRMRRLAGLWDIDLDIEVAPTLPVLEAHKIAVRVEEAIKERLEGVYDIVVHLEPAGNQEHEGFGLSE